LPLLRPLLLPHGLDIARVFEHLGLALAAREPLVPDLVRKLGAGQGRLGRRAGAVDGSDFGGLRRVGVYRACSSNSSSDAGNAGSAGDCCSLAQGQQA
jgi:hypothetical protein